MHYTPLAHDHKVGTALTRSPHTKNAPGANGVYSAAGGSTPESRLQPGVLGRRVRRLTSVGEVSYTYDHNGNPVCAGRTA
jgi:hypothetical protein